MREMKGSGVTLWLKFAQKIFVGKRVHLGGGCGTVGSDSPFEASLRQFLFTVKCTEKMKIK